LGRPQSTELEVNGGNKRNILARATPQADGGVVVVMHDVTEIRRLETIRRDFVANVSHELRTPVSIIRANAETLLNGALERPDQARRFVDALLRHADRLGRLISDLLDISRIEAGKYPIEPRSLKLAPVVRRIFESVDVRAQTKQMTLSMKIDDDLVLVADAKALEQVLLNLVENAIKYTPERGNIEVHARREGDCVRIEIMDDGPGIDPIHRPRIFERFYRVDPGRSREMGGTGLGLAIVKHLVEAMRGRVGVDGRTPSGSVFWVVMPAQE
jgi:two-component system phosphate regulon sensor histidine kinase PhoR